MAYQFYLSVKGKTQGVIKGSSTTKGREGQIIGLAMSYGVDVPLNVQSGLPTGRRQHKPIVITKTWDMSTPQLFQALVNNETLTTCSLTFYRPLTAGNDLLAMTINLINATISSYQGYTASPDQLNQYDANELEDIALVYQKIVITWAHGGKSAIDNWQALV